MNSYVLERSLRGERERRAVGMGKGAKERGGSVRKRKMRYPSYEKVRELERGTPCFTKISYALANSNLSPTVTALFQGLAMTHLNATASVRQQPPLLMMESGSRKKEREKWRSVSHPSLHYYPEITTRAPAALLPPSEK